MQCSEGAELDRSMRVAEHILTTMTEANLLSSAFSKWAAVPFMGWSTPRMSRTARKTTKGVEQGGRPANFRHPTRTVLWCSLGVNRSGQTWGSSSTRII